MDEDEMSMMVCAGCSSTEIDFDASIIGMGDVALTVLIRCGIKALGLSFRMFHSSSFILYDRILDDT